MHALQQWNAAPKVPDFNDFTPLRLIADNVATANKGNIQCMNRDDRSRTDRKSPVRLGTVTCALPWQTPGRGNGQTQDSYL